MNKKRQNLAEINLEMDKITKRRPSNEQIQELASVFSGLCLSQKTNCLKLLKNENKVKSDSYAKNKEK